MSKALSNLVEVIAGWRPEEVAGIAIARANEQIYCVVLDVGKLGFSPEAVVVWLEQYTSYVKNLAPKFGVKHPYPRVAILGRSLGHDITQKLRSLGAMVFDSDQPSHANITSLEALSIVIEEREAEVSEILNRSNRQIPHSPSITHDLNEEDRRLLNSYPEGVTHEQLDQLINRLNDET